jgi:hypothetical protein
MVDEIPAPGSRLKVEAHENGSFPVTNGRMGEENQYSAR